MMSSGFTIAAQEATEGAHRGRCDEAVDLRGDPQLQAATLKMTSDQ